MPRSRHSTLGRRTRHATNMAYRRSQSEETRSQENAAQQERNARRNRSTTPHNRNPASSRVRNLVRQQQMEFAAFNYDCEKDYSEHGQIGGMTVICTHCGAAKFQGETAGMCCANGKVKLPAFETPPDPLHSLIFDTSPTSKHFRSHIQEYNTPFQMTSFGATKIVRDNFMPTFKVITSCGMSSGNVTRNNIFFDVFEHSDPTSLLISKLLQIQGQIYHRAGSLLPYDNAEHQFLQIYFIDNLNDQVDRRCAIGSNTRRPIISQLQAFFHQHNELVALFKTAEERMPSDNHRIIIRADKTPIGEHARRFNAPTIDEVAIVIVGNQLPSRDIILHRRNEELKRISELHRSYDALQYPLLLWKGQDGYHLNIPMVDPRTGKLHINSIHIAMFTNFAKQYNISTTLVST